MTKTGAWLIGVVLLVGACDRKGSETTAEPSGKPSAAPVETTKVKDPLVSDTPAPTPPTASSDTPKANDCSSLCKSFSAKRAECVDLFVAEAKLNMPPAMIEKVKANHKKNAQGGECPRMCDSMAERVMTWGKCADSAKDCKQFVSCYQAANK